MSDLLAVNPQEQARADFERARQRAVVHDLAMKLLRRPNDLCSYAAARAAVAARGERPRGIMTVPVSRIVGSLDRVGDYDRAFRPRRAGDAARWQSVARAFYTGTELPLLKLYQIDDAFYVVDGHHRVSVARALGREFLDAEVTEVRTQPAGPPPTKRPARRHPSALIAAPTPTTAQPLACPA